MSESEPEQSVAQRTEELRKSEELYRSLFDNMLNGFAYCRMIFDQGQPQDFIYLSVNSAFESLTGLKNVAGKKASEVIPGIQESDAGLLEIYGRVALSGKPERFERYVEALKMWFSVSVYSPEKEHFVSVFDVITERKRAEDALQKSEKKYRLLVETLQEGIWFIDRDANTVYVNPRMAELLGYTVEEMLGKPLFNFMDERGVKLAKYNMERRRQGITEQHDFEFRRKDGSRIYTTLETTPVTDEQGNFVGALAGVVNITERKRAEEELRQKTALLEAQLGSSIDGILIVDTQGKKIIQNRRTVELWKIPQHIADNDDDDTQVRHVMRMTRNPEQFAAKIAHLYGHPDEISRDEVELTDGTVLDRYSAPVMGKDGQNFGRIWTFRDITERKRSEAEKAALEAQTRQLQKAESLGRMAGAIAHHFNNHLQVVMGNLELALEKRARAESPVHKNLTGAMRAARKAAEVSVQMLTYLGQPSGKREPMDLADACRRNLPMLMAAIPKNVTMQTDLPRPGPTINANANQIQEVLTNLGTNAWEAVGEGPGAVHLTVRTVSPADIPAAHRFPIDWQPQDQTCACLEVTDTGCGIAPKDIERLFDPFFSTKFTGRGLGLPVLLGIVRAHGGAVTVQSEPGRGSTFRVFFPVSAAAVPRRADKAAPAPGWERGDTVLLIEDERMVREVAAKMLSRLGLTVLEAGDGIEAVEVFRQHQDEILCVVCDLIMPRMNGWETLIALRKLKPDIPVILASGYDEASVMAGDHPERPQAFLAKPYARKELFAALGLAFAGLESPSAGSE